MKSRTPVRTTRSWQRVLKKNSSYRIQKERSALRDAVQKTLSEMKADGKLGEISTKWFGSDITIVK